MTELEICNLALGFLGEAAIASLSDGTVRAGLCSANYSTIRDALLEERDWQWATEWHQVLADATAPTNPRYLRRYAKPSSCLTVKEVVDEEGDALDWCRDGDYVLTDDVPGYAATAPVKTPDPDRGDDTVRVAITGTPTGTAAYVLQAEAPGGVFGWVLTIDGVVTAFTSGVALASGITITITAGDEAGDSYAWRAAPYVKMRGIKQASSSFPANFCFALAHRLASTLAPTLTEDRGLAQQQWALYEETLHKATSADAMQGRAFRGPTVSNLRRARES